MKDLNSYKVTSFDYRKEVRDLTKRIVNLEKEINIIRLENSNEISLKNEEILKLQNELKNIVSSNSWKITKPLRKIIITKKKKSNDMQFVTEKNEFDEEQYENSYKNYLVYTSNYQDDIDYSNYKTDIKPLAFYLPQYHTFKENDDWWGKGFMEWVNTKKAKPRFKNHYQPRIPHKDIGYYTLDNIETIKNQVELAKRHGVYGFCFYYYWFSGKRLMEKPLDLFLESKIKFPFCLCWANENWTRTWDGQQNDILISQKYSKNDYKKFILDIKKYITDSRYIKIDGKPLIMVYNPKEIPNFSELVRNWRKIAREENIGEIYICSKCDLADENFENSEFVDGEFEFPPQGIGHKETLITGLDSPKIYNYKRIVDDIEYLYHNHFPLKDFFYSCTMGWDNSARRKDGYTVYYNYSLESFYKWLRIIIEETRRRHKKEERYIFVNAWNEWAEGTYLEPDEKYGYANINTLSKAIYDLPLVDESKNNK